MGDASGRPLTVATFNIWGIPLASHAALSRPGMLGDMTAGAVLSHAKPGDRVVICFQEAWAFKVGLGQPVVSLARCLERCWPSAFTAAHIQTFDPRSIVSSALRVNSCCSLVAQLLALVMSKCCPCASLYDDHIRTSLSDSLRLWGLPYATGLRGEAGIHDMARGKSLDSGLLICSSVRPVAHGFVPYQHCGSEGGATKGFLWVLLPPPLDTEERNGLEGGGQLVITTHQHADQPDHPDPGSSRASQRLELIAGIQSLRDKYRPSLCVLCGDMNEPPDTSRADGLLAHLTAPPLNMRLLTGAAAGEIGFEGRPGTCIKDIGDGSVETLDHIFAAGDGIEGLLFEAMVPLRTPRSDHSLLLVNRMVMPGRNGKQGGAS